MSNELVPALKGVPVAESSVSYIDGNKGVLEYRGYPIETLARASSFEETCFLLLKGRLPNRSEFEAFDADIRHHRRLKYKLINILKLLPENGHPMDALTSSVAALGMFYPQHSVEDVEARYATSIRLIAKLPTIIAAFNRLRRGDEAILPRDDLSQAANFLYMLTERVPDPDVAKIFDACLVLQADHALNASTFVARITGSTKADAYGVISAAIATLAGPIHGGANEAALLNLKQLGSVDRVKSWVEENIRNQQIIAGFGHRAYKVKDPRATILQELAPRLFEKTGKSQLYDIALELERVVTQHLGHKGVYPNIDFYSGLLYDRMGIPSDLFPCIFSMSRISGWLAHWSEQLKRNEIYQPAQLYCGPRQQNYLPLSDRR